VKNLRRLGDREIVLKNFFMAALRAGGGA